MVHDFILGIPVLLFFPFAAYSGFCILKHIVFCLEMDRHRPYDERFMSGALFIGFVFAVGLSISILVALFVEYELGTIIFLKYGTLAVVCLAIIPPYSLREILYGEITSLEKGRFYFGCLLLLFVMLLWEDAKHYLEYGYSLIPVLLQRIGL